MTNIAKGLVVAVLLLGAACDRAEPTAAPAEAPSLNTTNQPPVAKYTFKVLGACDNTKSCYTYQLDASSSYDPDGYIVSYEWYDNGSYTSGMPTYTFSAFRAYQSCGAAVQGYVVVTDNHGAQSTACFSYTPLL